MPIFIPDVARFPTRFDSLPGGEYQSRMRECFVQQAREMLYQASQSPDGKMFQIGFEVEFSVVDGDFSPVSQSVRDAAIEAFANEGSDNVSFVAQELGAAQIEVTTLPVDLRTNRALAALEELQSRERRLAAWLHQRNAFLFRIGAHPLIPIRKIQRTAGVEKYQKCPQFHNMNQRPGIDRFIGLRLPIDVSDALIPGITNSVQINIDCIDPNDAIEMLNRSMVVAPITTALGANAGFLDCQDSGYADVRYMAWAVSHDLRTWDEVFRRIDHRVGLPSRYYRDMDDYLSSVISHPFFMEKAEAAFPMAIGTYWRDSRIKFLKKPDRIQIVLEFRPLSTQPTAADDFALCMFMLGRIVMARHRSEPLVDIENVRANKEQAMRMGRDAQLATVMPDGTKRTLSFQELAPTEVSLALEGLKVCGIDEESIAFVQDRLHRRLFGQIPVDRFRSLVQNELARGADQSTAIRVALNESDLLSQ